MPEQSNHLYEQALGEGDSYAAMLAAILSGTRQVNGDEADATTEIDWPGH